MVVVTTRKTNHRTKVRIAAEADKRQKNCKGRRETGDRAVGGVKCGDSLQAKQPISSFPPFLTLVAKVVGVF